MAGEDESSRSERYREIVGLFRNPEDLERAISRLAGAGWDRAEMSLLAQHGILTPDAVTRDSASIADDEATAREAVVSEPDVRQGRTLVAGMAGVVGAFLASGATIMTGGSALAAVIGAAVLGGGAAATVDALAHRVGEQRGEFMREQIEHGGIMLFAKLRDAAHEKTGGDIMRACGAVDVHVHELPKSDAAGQGRAAPRDPVEEASMESFPASDPPSWTGAQAGAADRTAAAPATAPQRRSREKGKKR